MSSTGRRDRSRKVVRSCQKSSRMDRKVVASASLIFMQFISDAGTLPLILYSHEQLLQKVSELKENALYIERITAAKGPAPKRPKRKESRSAEQSASVGPSTSSDTRPRPSDPQHAEDPVEFPVTATVSASPLKEVIDVHSEMYGVPNLAVLYEVMVHLNSNYGLQLRPVSTYFSLHYCFTSALTVFSIEL